jgi:hypothetical protein
MSYAQLSRWVMSIYSSGLEDGREEQVVIEITPDDIMKELAQLKGVGPKRQAAIRDVLIAMQHNAEKGVKRE